jgi:hypothetical protein
VPKLSAEAAAALEAVHTASTGQPGESWSVAATRDQASVARAWEKGQRNPTVAAEIARFEKAAAQRLGGEEGVTTFLHNAADGRLSLPGIAPRRQLALGELGRGLAAARRGRLDHQRQRAGRSRAPPRATTAERPASPGITLGAVARHGSARTAACSSWRAVGANRFFSVRLSKSNFLLSAGTGFEKVPTGPKRWAGQNSPPERVAALVVSRSDGPPGAPEASGRRSSFGGSDRRSRQRTGTAEIPVQ